MLREKSAGVIVFRFHPKEGVQYLVLYHRGNYWNFPKGHVEQGETETQGALRELQEETGITGIHLVDGWRQQTEFFFKEDRGDRKELIKKDFILYLAKAPIDMVLKISPEHNGYGWLDLKTANKYLRFKGLKEILSEADSYVNAKIEAHKHKNG